MVMNMNQMAHHSLRLNTREYRKSGFPYSLAMLGYFLSSREDATMTAAYIAPIEKNTP